MDIPELGIITIDSAKKFIEYTEETAKICIDNWGNLFPKMGKTWSMKNNAGYYHNKIGPSYISTENGWDTGFLYDIVFYHNGIKYRDSGPANVTIRHRWVENVHNYGYVTLTFYKNGRIHSDKGPAEIKYWKNEWITFGWVHEGKFIMSCKFDIKKEKFLSH
jgi:hypothetical protein